MNKNLLELWYLIGFMPNRVFFCLFVCFAFPLAFVD